jgi:hypothetical protein
MLLCVVLVLPGLNPTSLVKDKTRYYHTPFSLSGCFPGIFLWLQLGSCCLQLREKELWFTVTIPIVNHKGHKQNTTD